MTVVELSNYVLSHLEKFCALFLPILVLVCVCLSYTRLVDLWSRLCGRHLDVLLNAGVFESFDVENELHQVIQRWLRVLHQIFIANDMHWNF